MSHMDLQFAIENLVIENLLIGNLMTENSGIVSECLEQELCVVSRAIDLLESVHPLHDVMRSEDRTAESKHPAAATRTASASHSRACEWACDLLGKHRTATTASLIHESW